MADARLSKGSETVTIPLLDEGGSPLVSSDLGKPEVNLQGGGAYFQRSLDSWSGLENVTMRGRFVDSDAYTDAYELVDMLQSDWGSDRLRLDLDLPEYDSDMLVAPSAGSDRALALDYQPGRRNDVVVDLSLTRIGRVLGTADRDPLTTPTASGTGPVEIRALGNTVSVSTDLRVGRTAGRPRDVVRRQPGVEFPYYINKHKTIAETITLEFLLHETPVADLQSIGTIFRSQLGREPVTLDFNGVYGLGEFSVLPTGSAPFRQVRRAGEQGMVTCPTFEFTRVYDPS